jgi:hypothetical protein
MAETNRVNAVVIQHCAAAFAPRLIRVILFPINKSVPV